MERRGAMYTGEFRHTVDSKGRLSLPAIHRRALPPQVVISKGFDDTLFVFSPEDYEAWLTSLVPYDDLDEDIRAFYRWLTAGATTVELDSAGRVSISALLRKHASLDKDVVVLGNRDRIEIWDAERWDEYNSSHGSIDELVEKVRSKKSE